MKKVDLHSKNREITQLELDRLNRLFCAGTRVVAVKMKLQTPREGTEGTVVSIEPTGDLLIKWDDGTVLKSLYFEDQVRLACVKRPKITVISKEERV